MHFKPSKFLLIFLKFLRVSFHCISSFADLVYKARCLFVVGCLSVSFVGQPQESQRLLVQDCIAIMTKLGNPFQLPRAIVEVQLLVGWSLGWLLVCGSTITKKGTYLLNYLHASTRVNSDSSEITYSTDSRDGSDSSDSSNSSDSIDNSDNSDGSESSDSCDQK